MKKTYQMYFGRNTPSGYVTDANWEQFRDVLGMSFAGYTVQDVQGAWKGTPEDSKLVTVLPNILRKYKMYAKHISIYLNRMQLVC